MHYNEVIAAEMKGLLYELRTGLTWISREDYGDLTSTIRRMEDQITQLNGIANIIRATTPDTAPPPASPLGVPLGSGRGPGIVSPAPEVLAEQPDDEDEEERPDGRDVYMKVRRMGGVPPLGV